MHEGNSANGAMLSSYPAEIEVFSGGFVDLKNPEPKTLVINDVARGMAFTCRYGGHVKRFYSVAEHAILVHDLLAHMGHTGQQLLGGLMHDAAEAYLGDVVAPLKWAMREEAAELVEHGRSLNPYDTLTARMERAIAWRFTVDQKMFDTPELRTADMWALRIEAAALTTSGGAHWRWPGVLPFDGKKPDEVTWRGGLDPESARLAWLHAVHSWTEAQA